MLRMRVAAFPFLLFLFLGALPALAWSGPTQSPPNGNVPPPVNVGVQNGGDSTNVFQDKLTSGDALHPAGLWVDDGIGINSGSKFCIGSSCITSWAQAGSAASQWTTSGSSIYYNGGNVGINTSNPGTPFESVGAAVFTSGTSGAQALEIAPGNGGATLWSNANYSDAHPQNNWVSTMTLNAGNVGINTATPGATLEVNGTIQADTQITGPGPNNYWNSSVFDLAGGSGKMYVQNIVDGNTGSNNITLSGGNVGIKNSSPTQALDVGGTVKATQYCIGASCVSSWPGASTNYWTLSGNTLSQNSGSTLSLGSALVQPNGAGLFAYEPDGTTMDQWMWPRWSDNVMYTNFGPNGWNIRNNSSGNVMFLTNGGDVGINTTSPTKPLDVNGVIRGSNEIISSTINGYGNIRMIGGNYGAFFRNDGTNTYLLFTKSDDQYGQWNSLRPFSVNDSTGAVSMNNGLTVSGGLTANQYCIGSSCITSWPGSYTNTDTLQTVTDRGNTTTDSIVAGEATLGKNPTGGTDQLVLGNSRGNSYLYAYSTGSSGVTLGSYIGGSGAGPLAISASATTFYGTTLFNNAATFNTGPYTNDWFRVNGGGGIYWQPQYSGSTVVAGNSGFTMSDTSWIRSYGSAGLWMNSANIGTNGGLTIGYGGAGAPAGGAIFSSNVGVGNNNPQHTLDVTGTAAVSGFVNVGGLEATGNVTADTKVVAGTQYCQGNSSNCGWSGTVTVRSSDPSLAYTSSAYYGANNCTINAPYPYTTIYAPGTVTTAVYAGTYQLQDDNFFDSHSATYTMTYAGGIVVSETTNTICQTYDTGTPYFDYSGYNPQGGN